MAKNTCAICGADVNFMTGQKLIDGNYICRKVCRKKGMGVFDYANATLPLVKAHLSQVEFGAKAWNAIFTPRLKSKDNNKKLKQFGIGESRVFVSESTGLMALEESRYKVLFFGKTVYACVYRIADLYDYYLEDETKTIDGKTETRHFGHLIFHNVDGLSDFRIELANAEYGIMEKYFNEMFGIQKTLSNAGNTWTSQIDAVKAVGAAVGAVSEGGDAAQCTAAEALYALNIARYGDHTALAARADAALASVRN